jgi:hypothetical protein
MEYHVQREKVGKLKSWGIATALAFIYSVIFIGWISFLYIAYNFFANTYLNAFNFTRVEFLILASNFLFVFVLLVLYFRLKQNNTEDVVLNETGILLNKYFSKKYKT